MNMQPAVGPSARALYRLHIAAACTHALWAILGGVAYPRGVNVSVPILFYPTIYSPDTYSTIHHDSPTVAFKYHSLQVGIAYTITFFLSTL